MNDTHEGYVTFVNIERTVPEEDDILEFDPISLIDEEINNEGVDYARITLNTGNIAFVPVSMLKAQEKEQTVTQFNKISNQYYLFKNYLNSNPRKIKETATQLKNDARISPAYQNPR